MSDLTPEDLAAKFWDKVDFTSNCWQWTGAFQGSGYGSFSAGKTVLAHRWAYQFIYGCIPSGMDLDHLCRNRGCVHPEHLEPVTSKENCYRSTAPTAINAQKLVCVHGHRFTPENTYFRKDPGRVGHRACVTCMNINSSKQRARRRALRKVVN